MTTDWIEELERGAWQCDLGSLPDEAWQVAIVGAGPAGATAAIHLADRGHQVLLLDKQRFPRDKTCGDGLITDSIRCLRRAGVWDRVYALGHELNAVSMFSPGGIEVRMDGFFLTLKRRLLDAIIAKRAVEAGAVFVAGGVAKITTEEDGSVALSVDGRDQPLRAAICLIATGVDMRLARDLQMVERPEASALAMRCYVRSELDLDRMVASYDRSIVPGYGWIFPMGDGEFNLGIGMKQDQLKERRINLKDTLATFTSTFPLARELMQKGEMISPLRGALLRTGLTGTDPVGPGNVLAIGETIGATLPYTGEGIGKAMESGEVAADLAHEALSSGDFSRLSQYTDRLTELLKPRYLGYEVAQSWMSWTRLNDFVARRANKSRFLQESLAGILTETVDPRTIFSVRGVLKSFFR